MLVVQTKATVTSDREAARSSLPITTVIIYETKGMGFLHITRPYEGGKTIERLFLCQNA